MIEEPDLDSMLRRRPWFASPELGHGDPMPAEIPEELWSKVTVLEIGSDQGRQAAVDELEKLGSLAIPALLDSVSFISPSGVLLNFKRPSESITVKLSLRSTRSKVPG